MQGGRGVGPGVKEMPDLSYGVKLLAVPEAGEFVVGEQADEGFVVMLVDGFEGGFTVRFGGGRGALGRGEVLVSVAPFLGEVGPGDGGGEEADGGGDGGGGVEGESSLLGKSFGDGGAPVDEGAEDLLEILVRKKVSIGKRRVDGELHGSVAAFLVAWTKASVRETYVEQQCRGWIDAAHGGWTCKQLI